MAKEEKEKIMEKIINFVTCPKCNSNEIAVLNDEYGMCKNCNYCIEIPKIDESIPRCSLCGSTDITELTEEIGKCNNCNYCVKLPKKESSKIDETKDNQIKVETVINSNNDNNKIVAIACPQCGSTDVKFINDDIAKCNMCNSNITIPKKNEPINVTNNIYVNNEKEDDGVEYYAIKKEFSESNFMRNVMLDFASDVRTPDDILDGTFDKVSIGYGQYLITSGEAEISYSATIGYDKKVEYQEWDGKKYVTKTRTETEWRPFSGTNKGSYTSCVVNSDNTKQSPFDHNFEHSYHSAKNTSIVPYSQVDFKTAEPLAPYNNAIKNAKLGILIECEAEAKEHLPGDRNKDFNANGISKLNSINSFVVPFYKVNFNYNNIKIENKSFAFGNFKRIGETVDTSQNMMDIVNKKTKGLDLFSIFFSICWMLIMTPIFVFTKLPSFLTLFGLLVVVIKILAFKKYKMLINEIISISQQKKHEHLTTLFNIRKYSPLTSEEHKKFSATDKKLPKTKHKLRKAGTILTIICASSSFFFAF